MASTITLARTIGATVPMIGYRPLTFASASTPTWEPAVTMANMILLTILGPPLAWRWNRGSAPNTFTCVIGQTDYPVTLSTFGWIEWAAAKDPTEITPRWHEMNIFEGLAVGVESSIPNQIAAQYDNGAGQITFRVLPAPDQAYPVQMDIQQKATLFPNTSACLTQDWAPIPDEYSHLYTWGFQALGLLLAGDPRFAELNSKFISALLSTHQGLSEVKKNAFLNNWMMVTGSPEVLAARLAQGVQARAV